MFDSSNRRLPSLRGARILLLDSNRTMLSLYREVVRSAGASAVFDCSSTVAALEVCKQHRPDAALVEYELAEMSGAEFVRFIRNASDTAVPNLAVVMMSGIRQRSVVEEAVAAGSDSFILKPASATVIVERTRGALQKRGWFQAAA
jgi:DNA-binding NarL/FixJ family response regulator